MYYVVVKNEQGTKGKYKIEVDAPSFPALGGVNPDPANSDCDAYCQATHTDIAYIPPVAGGPVPLGLHFVQSFSEFVGYFPVQLPDYHDGTLSVSSPPVVAGDGLWDFDLFDAAGHPLPGGDTDITQSAAG